MPHDLFSEPRAVAPAVLALRQSLSALSGRDRETAASLLAQADRRPLSDRQTTLAVALVERAKAPPAPTTTGLAPIVEMLGHAAMSLKWPVVRFEAEGIRYRLGRAGPEARDPGSVSVTSDDKRFEDRTFYGRIDVLGTFHPHHRQVQAATAIGAALRAFAEAPAEQARLYGQRFGRCCFCGLELTNGRSIAAGYGPICAEKFGLPWGGA